MTSKQRWEASAPLRAMAAPTSTANPGVAELAAGKVDGDGHRRGVERLVGPPGGGLGGGLGHDPGAEGNDEAGLLRDGDELRRRDEPPLRVLEPDERLGAGHGAGGQVDQRLVVEPQAVVVEGVAEHRLRPEPVEASGAEPVLEELDPVAAVVLGPVHGDVGVPQERRRGGGARRPEGVTASARHRPDAVPGADRAIPTLAVTTTCWPAPIGIGTATASRSRRARERASSPPAMSSARTTNSSPPRRATVSAEPHDALQPSGRPRPGGRRRRRGRGSR